jgi:glycosyltransferase involved in cell wall biosynthesis
MLNPTLSVCLIVKNEQKFIRRCLESVKDIADEIIIVDTGSTDSTLDIVREYGAKVIESQWCNDFSYSRNLGLEEAKSQWILVLDGDEELCKDDIKILKEALQMPFEGYNLSLINYIDINQCDYVTDYVCRLFKNNKLYRFKNRIHEEVFSNIVENNVNEVVGNLPVRIFHYGYVKGINQKEKNTRNLKLLELQLQECSEEDKPYYLYALGVEYFQSEQFEKGEELLRLALAGTPASTTGFRSDCYLKLILCQLNKREYYLVEEIFQKALEEYPDFVDLYFLRGQVLYNQLRFSKALSYFNKCLALPLLPKYTSAAGINSYRALYFKGMCHYYLGNFAESEKCFAHSIKIEPSYFLSFKSWVEVRVKLNKPIDLKGDIFQKNTYYLNETRKIMWRRGRWQEARRLWKKRSTLTKPYSCLITGECKGCIKIPEVSQEELTSIFFAYWFNEGWVKVEKFLNLCPYIVSWEIFLQELIEALAIYKDMENLWFISQLPGLKPRLLILCTVNLAFCRNLYAVERLLPSLPLFPEEKELLRINTWIYRAKGLS